MKIYLRHYLYHGLPIEIGYQLIWGKIMAKQRKKDHSNTTVISASVIFFQNSIAFKTSVHILWNSSIYFWHSFL